MADRPTPSNLREIDRLVRDSPRAPAALARANRQVASRLLGSLSIFGGSDEASGMTLDELLGAIDDLTEEQP